MLWHGTCGVSSLSASRGPPINCLKYRYRGARDKDSKKTWYMVTTVDHVLWATLETRVEKWGWIIYIWRSRIYFLTEVLDRLIKIKQRKVFIKSVKGLGKSGIFFKWSRILAQVAKTSDCIACMWIQDTSTRVHVCVQEIPVYVTLLETSS